MKDKILLCIPGSWAAPSDFIEKFGAGTNDRFAVKGSFIHDRESGFSFEFDIFPPHEGMDDGFRMGAEAAPISDQILTDIRHQNGYMALRSNHSGVAAALVISEVASAVLDCGGLAVRVEGAKRASDPDRWRRAVHEAQSIASNALRSLFVWSFVAGENTFDTIGMPFLGHPDLSIETDDIDVANTVYHEFANYLIYQNPDVLDGQTIGFEGVGGIWSITRTNHFYHDDPDIDFSTGMLRLQPV